jgi:arginase
MAREICIIEAPLSVGVGLSGVERLPTVLAAAGLAQAIGAARSVRELPVLAAPAYDPAGKPAAAEELRDYLLRLADLTAQQIMAGAMPIIVGGDCTVLLGALLGAKQTGSRGLLFVDGHTDYNLPGVPDNETASMDLRLALGEGDEPLARLDPNGPLIDGTRIAAFGFRDEAMIAAVGGRVPPAERMLLLPERRLRSHGFGNCAAMALSRAAPDDAPFWLHLDLDVIDDSVMPAVDYRLPGGISLGEASAIVHRAHATGRLAGIDVTILNPALDHDGACVRCTVGLLASALRG